MQQAPQNMDAVYVDLNSLIHSAARNSRTREQCLQRCVGLIMKVVPRQNFRHIHLAVDGPGALAKMAEQKRRRSNRAKSNKVAYDTRNVTPGTSFMHVLELELERCCALLVHRQGLRDRVVQLTGHAVNGEGEVKILNQLIHNRQAGSARHLIIGSDGDILFQVLATNATSTWVTNEESNITFSTDDFRLALMKDFPDHDPALIALDIAILIVFQGNDYLPGMAWYRIEHSMQSYCNVLRQRPREHLVNLGDETLNWSFFHAVVSQWSTKGEFAGPSAPNVSEGGRDAMDVPDVDEEAEDIRRWQIDPATEEIMARKYLQGEMSVNGICPDYSFIYLYGRAPSRKALLAHVQLIMRGNAAGLSWARSEPLAAHPVVCAAMLLGQEGKFLVDHTWRSLHDIPLPADLASSQRILGEAFTELHSRALAARVPCAQAISHPDFGKPVEFTHTLYADGRQHTDGTRPREEVVEGRVPSFHCSAGCPSFARRVELFASSSDRGTEASKS
ncbi:hypothetical protein HKX48_001448 [Thoreauomyces humboldtii]|nr:hypothetical protein HKX48_001448 [Thoreauomyces humboldtii]